jgi:hypothetical protein
MPQLLLLRIFLFAVGFTLIDLGGTAAWIAPLGFLRELQSSNLWFIVIWSSSYLVIGIVCLFSTFKLNWLNALTLNILGTAGIAISTWHVLVVQCKAIDENQVNVYQFLSCTMHPAGYLGILGSGLLVSVAFFNRRRSD